MIKRRLWILALTTVISACSSGVKLNDVPVEDKAASGNDASSSMAQSSVAPVVSGSAGTQGVAPAGRVRFCPSGVPFRSFLFVSAGLA